MGNTCGRVALLDKDELKMLGLHNKNMTRTSTMSRGERAPPMGPGESRNDAAFAMRRGERSPKTKSVKPSRCKTSKLGRIFKGLRGSKEALLFEGLPGEIKRNIASFCSTRDLLRLRQTGKTIRSELDLIQHSCLLTDETIPISSKWKCIGAIIPGSDRLHSIALEGHVQCKIGIVERILSAGLNRPAILGKRLLGDLVIVAQDKPSTGDDCDSTGDILRSLRRTGGSLVSMPPIIEPSNQIYSRADGEKCKRLKKSGVIATIDSVMPGKAYQIWAKNLIVNSVTLHRFGFGVGSTECGAFWLNRGPRSRKKQIYTRSDGRRVRRIRKPRWTKIELKETYLPT